MDALLAMPTYALSLLGRRARAEMASWLPDGLRLGHLAVLGALDDGVPRSQRELGEVLEIHPSDMVAIVEELVGEGLVVRERDPDDRRRYAVATTPAGRALVADASAESARIADGLLAALPRREREQVLRGLSRALEADRARDVESAASNSRR